MSTPTPTLVPTLTPRTATPCITAAPPQSPKSPKGEASAKPKDQGPSKVSTEKPTALKRHHLHPAVASTSMSSASVDTKCGVKRVHEDEADGGTPKVTSAPSPKRVKSDGRVHPTKKRWASYQGACIWVLTRRQKSGGDRNSEGGLPRTLGDSDVGDDRS